MTAQENGTAARPPARFGLALLAGAAASLIGALAWGTGEYAGGRLYAPLPLLMGLWVGLAVNLVKPADLRGPIASALLAVLGCAFGPFLLVMLEGTVRSHASVVAIFGRPSGLLRAYVHAVGGRFGVFGFLTWLLAAFLAFMFPLRHSIVPVETRGS